MLKRGLSASIPIMIGYLPVSITFGITALTLGFNKLETILASALIFAGASQFALISLLPISFTEAVVIPVFLNLRHIVYSYITSRRIKPRKPFLLSFGLTDEVFARSLNSPKNEKFILGLELGSYLAWVGGTVMGVFFGAVLLSTEVLTPSLVFSLTALFFVLLIPNLKEKRLLSAIIGGTIALTLHLTGYTSAGILIAGIATPLILKGAKKVRR
jgi:4-azaleucine resistance transporter AzlC